MFGADLTRHFQSSMVLDKPVLLETSGNHPTFLFCPAEYRLLYRQYPDHLMKIADKRTLGRGMIRIDMDSPEGLADAEEFVRIYERNSGLKIACLEEISKRMGVFTE